MLCESKGNLDSSFELTYRTKRQLTLIGLTLRRFATGLDYMIILPSLWFYLQTFNSWYFMLGLVIAADSFVAFFLSHWIALLGERWRKVRFFGFLGNLFHVAGSMLYALSLYYYMPLVGRLVSGVGLSFDGALYAEVKHICGNPEERNRVLIIMGGVRMFGIVIAPGMNLFLRTFNLTIGPWTIDQHTAPGFFMVLVWALVQIVHVFTVYDLGDDPDGYKELADDETPRRRRTTPTANSRLTPSQDKPPSSTEVEPQRRRALSKDAMISDGISMKTMGPSSDDKSIVSDEKSFGSDDKNVDSESEDEDADIDKSSLGIVAEESDEKKNEDAQKYDFPSSVESDRNENFEERLISTTSPEPSLPAQPSDGCLSLLGRRDVILILLTQFLMFFNQTAFETLVLLVGVEKLDFDIVILSGVFIIAGVEMVVVIILVWSANKALDAKYSLMAALSSGILASFARLAISFTIPHHAGCWAMTILTGVFTIVGTPLTSISGKTLLPKITHPDHHAFYQSAFATSQHLGLIIGPLVVSVLYDYLVAFSSVMVFIFLVLYTFAMHVIERVTVPAYGCGDNPFKP